MISVDFTKQTNPKWDKKIAYGLRKEYESLIGMAEDFQTHTIYATHAKTLVGGIILEQHRDILWIDALWVEPDFRKHGIGAQLLQKALHSASQYGIKEMQLNTFFKKAHTFFLSCGFEDVAMIPEWKYGLNCYLMRKKVKER